mmetsp:Transcript_18744/g.37891  ORF Transcript_18744/g.37891 Transcript_18744/m.37891 type:complete len:90 (-) Transcript_18744:939-1208(-)
MYIFFVVLMAFPDPKLLKASFHSIIHLHHVTSTCKAPIGACMLGEKRKKKKKASQRKKQKTDTFQAINSSVFVRVYVLCRKPGSSAAIR